MMGNRVNKKYLCVVHVHLVGTGRCIDLLQKTDHAMKVYPPPSLSSRCWYNTGIPNAFNCTATTASIIDGIKLVRLTYKSILNFSIDRHHHHHRYNIDHYHHAIKCDRASVSLDTGMESNVGTFATAGADKMM